MDNEIDGSSNNSIGRSMESITSTASTVSCRSKFTLNLWRPNSIVNLMNNKKRNSTVFESIPTTENAGTASNAETSQVSSYDDKRLELPIKKDKSGWGSNVSIVLVEAKGLPDAPNNGSSHGVYCKIRLGSQAIKSKTVLNSHHPEWRERFKLQLYKDHLLRISLWDKGKQKIFMGSAVLDLSRLEKERTHSIWQRLDDGYGLVHFTVTMCNIRNSDTITCNDDTNVDEFQEKYALYNINTNWKLVGQLHVKIIAAKGLSGKPNAYCTLELDNERVRTHNARASSDPAWNKSYLFNVYDVTSTLDVKVYDSSLVNALRGESIGRVSIPLLRIRTGEIRWYGLKDKNKRNSAKGSCPRVQLEISLFWNPMKASLRLFQPKEVKYIKKPPKFDISLVYKNLEFVRDSYLSLYEINEHFKRLFEWENQELSSISLFGWLMFWYHFRLWTAPLFFLIPFFYFWICNRHQQEKSFLRGYGIVEESSDDENNKVQNDKSLAERLQALPDMTLTITNGTDYLASVAERIYNLASFKVPFLSYIAMVLLVVASIVLYLIPFNYLLMGLGIYKFTRKYMNPERMLNNDLLDFISRIPDSEVLKDWKELNVPEPSLQRNLSNKI